MNNCRVIATQLIMVYGEERGVRYLYRHHDLDKLEVAVAAMWDEGCRFTGDERDALATDPEVAKLRFERYPSFGKLYYALVVACDRNVPL
jgi:hypothetical protein